MAQGVYVCMHKPVDTEQLLYVLSEAAGSTYLTGDNVVGNVFRVTRQKSDYRRGIYSGFLRKGGHPCVSSE